MYKILFQVIDDNAVACTEAVHLICEDGMKFIEALVSFCNKEGIDVPLWTSVQERHLKRDKEVWICLDAVKNLYLKISAQ